MIVFTTKCGAVHHLDLRNRVLQVGGRTLRFTEVHRLHEGSPGAIFYDGDYIAYSTSGIVSLEGIVPADAELPEPEPGHVLFRTRNSLYEIDQEQKLIRRVTGNNPATRSFEGDWNEYSDIIYLEVGRRAGICWPNSTRLTLTSTIREIAGDIIPTPPVEAQ